MTPERAAHITATLVVWVVGTAIATAIYALFTWSVPGWQAVAALGFVVALCLPHWTSRRE